MSWVTSNTSQRGTIGVEVNITDEAYARLMYGISDGEGNVTNCDTKVDLVTTPCNLGGSRYWFVCPLCGRRVAGLYLPPGSVHFWCRRCYGLSYLSRNRGKIEAWGHTSMQIEKLYGEIKRWTWRGRSTRKVRRLYNLQRKVGMLSPQISARFGRFKPRLS